MARIPDILAHLEAFIALPGQGINYGAGTWHHPMVALDEPADFAMLVWEAGNEGDCLEFPLSQPIEIVDSRFQRTAAASSWRAVSRWPPVPGMNW